VIRFLESVAEWRPEIRFFGGEPFLHPEWSRIFSAAVANGLPITVVTNGTRLLGRAEELVESGVLAIGISVDPPLAHDAFRGKGTFSTCERVVREIHQARARLGSRTPSVVIYTTVYEETYGALTRWAEQLRDWKIDMLRLQHQIWLGNDRRSAWAALSLPLPGHGERLRAFLRERVERIPIPGVPPPPAKGAAPPALCTLPGLTLESKDLDKR
jgi:MoaA/NifB/PqqE/SkfB family radical SAM enzyme